MLFYRTRMLPEQRLGPMSTAHISRNIPESANATMRGVWMVKCFMTGVALLGLAYWLVQIAGAQYLATLTSATLLSFLLVYIVWCLTVKRRHQPQNTDSVGVAEPSTQATTSSLMPPSSLHLNPALKHYGVPARDCSPPPTYEEVLLQMAAAASTSGAATAAVTQVDAESPRLPPSEIQESPPGTSPSAIYPTECHDQVETINETTCSTSEAHSRQPTPPSTPVVVTNEDAGHTSPANTEPDV